MTTIFDYLDNNKLYTTNEVNLLVDKQNTLESKAHKHNLQTIIKELDSVYNELCNVFEKHIKHEHPTVQLTDCVQCLKQLSPDKQFDLHINELLQKYDELKLLYDRYKSSPPTLQHVTSSQVNEFNIRNFIDQQRREEHRREQALQTIIEQQKQILSKLKELTSNSSSDDLYVTDVDEEKLITTFEQNLSNSNVDINDPYIDYIA